MLDVPSHVLFPWLHGINDDGQKGRDMAAFFGYVLFIVGIIWEGSLAAWLPLHTLSGQATREA